MTKRPTFEDFLKESMEDPEFKAGYELLQAKEAVRKQFVNARKKANCSQEELAQRLKLQQPAIARLEKGGYTTTTVSRLAKVAAALGYTLKVSLLPEKTAKKSAVKKTIKRTLAKKTKSKQA